MKRSRTILYIAFIIIFLIFHVTGVLAESLPYIFNALITFTVVFISIVIFDKWYSRVSFSEVLINLGFHKTSVKNSFPGVLISIIILLIYPVFRFVFGFDLYLNPNWLLNLAGLCLTAGLAEEMFFRGFLFRHLRYSMNFKQAALKSMLLFTAAHLMMFTYMEWSVALFSTLLAGFISVPLAFLFETANNTVWSPALVHIVIRTIGLVISGNESVFMQMTLIWIFGCMIIPLIVIMFFKSFREMWSRT